MIDRTAFAVAVVSYGLLSCAALDARVTRIVIEQRESPTYKVQAFGKAGQYYGSHAGYVAAVRAAAEMAVGERFLLREDADQLIAQASNSDVLAGR
jgi:hypothetical protein